MCGVSTKVHAHQAFSWVKHVSCKSMGYNVVAEVGIGWATLFLMQSPCPVTSSSVLSQQRKEWRTSGPTIPFSSHSGLDGNVVALPPGCTIQIVRCLLAGAAKLKQQAYRIRTAWITVSLDLNCMGWPSMVLVAVCLEVSSIGTLNAGFLLSQQA